MQAWHRLDGPDYMSEIGSCHHAPLDPCHAAGAEQMVWISIGVRIMIPCLSPYHAAGAAAAGLDPSVWVSPASLHLTVLMLKLYSGEARRLACEASFVISTGEAALMQLCSFAARHPAAIQGQRLYCENMLLPHLPGALR